jgi:hypothetical protein
MQLQRGNQFISKADLDLIEVPEPTRTFIPVPHRALADTMGTISQDLLTDFQLVSEVFEVARFGNQFFGTMNFKRNGGSENAYFAIGFKNSYDRSMAIGVVLGASIICCSNGMFSGQITILKKHTIGVWKAIEDLFITSLYRSQKSYENVIADSWQMQKRLLTDREAYGILGNLYGLDCLSPRQFTTAVSEWRSPSYAEFEPRNLFSLYNGATHALKSEPPISKAERHVRLHNAVIDL